MLSDVRYFSESVVECQDERVVRQSTPIPDVIDEVQDADGNVGGEQVIEIAVELLQCLARIEMPQVRRWHLANPMVVKRKHFSGAFRSKSDTQGELKTLNNSSWRMALLTCQRPTCGPGDPTFRCHIHLSQVPCNINFQRF